MTDETPFQRKWRELRERQEAKAKDWDARATVLKRRLKTARKHDEYHTPFGQGDNLGESPDF